MGNFLGCSCQEKGDTPLIEIKQKRSCTDVPVLLVFIGLWVVVVALLSAAVEKGADPNRLIKGTDYKDRVCGVDDGVSDKPLAAWPKVPLTAELIAIKVCVASCTETAVPPLQIGSSVFSYTKQPIGYVTEECKPYGVYIVLLFYGCIQATH